MFAIQFALVALSARFYFGGDFDIARLCFGVAVVIAIGMYLYERSSR